LIPLDADDDSLALQNEFFGPVLAVATLPGRDSAEFLHNAVNFCNAELYGTLAADLIIHPTTMRQLGLSLDRAVSELRYGAVGINGWASIVYRVVQAPWGAYQDVSGGSASGVGTVHNALLFDKPQKSVVRGLFYPFPRSWRKGQIAFLPKPPWFVTQRTRTTVARRVAALELDRNPLRLLGIFAAALRG
jgi:aldehyde dehydrogenase (NAD(P)+)